MSALPAMEEAKEIISTASTLSLRPDYVMVDSKLADGTVFVPANATAFAGVLVASRRVPQPQQQTLTLS